MPTKRNVIEIHDDSTSDEFEAYLTPEHMRVRIDEPWSGSTESGFGHECSFELSREQAIDFAKAVLAFYDIPC